MCGSEGLPGAETAPPCQPPSNISVQSCKRPWTTNIYFTRHVRSGFAYRAEIWSTLLFKKRSGLFPPQNIRAGQSRPCHSSPLSVIHGLPKLWLSPMAVIPQVGCIPRLIFNFTWSGLNKAITRKPPKEVMSFRRHLPPYYQEGPHNRPKSSPSLPRGGGPCRRLHVALGPASRTPLQWIFSSQRKGRRTNSLWVFTYPS